MIWSWNIAMCIDNLNLFFARTKKDKELCKKIKSPEIQRQCFLDTK